MNLLLIILEFLLLFVLYPVVWWIGLKYLLESYPLFNYLKLLSLPLSIGLVCLFFIILRDSVRFIVVFLVEGPNAIAWLAKQLSGISRSLFFSWLLLPITVSLVSRTNNQDYYYLKKKVKRSVKKWLNQHDSSSKRRKKSKKHKKKETRNRKHKR